MNSQKLLLVISNKKELESLGISLIEAGYEVITASSPSEALYLSNSQQPDLVILEMELYKTKDADLGRELSSNGVPFILLCDEQRSMLSNHEAYTGSLGIIEQTNDITQIIQCINHALSCASEIRRLKESERRYSNAIQTGRVVDVAVGILMERHHIEQERAFEMLRSKARSERRKLRDLAEELLDAEERLNQLNP
ncbi:MAG: ANTAR domain-containing protein [Candidatus Thiodiazotropha sp.]|nr:ANTAR domain-containing protein [Candidatus Thiodiazotropha sp.]MCU7804424.1 ANTAR domain-containing protein [Candidatus Thiodiazotropha sp. (ex Lucinoma borealis)]MCU7840737.1 ANTAR domain-containing protein [Candidatus Thiodiazotropha sp. (ex Troendleina suluensis)]MCU7884033.1 ANTAR domain-containing protein [Candidatus Thiodiazotropha sp. (ex Lucinoma annulata)]MCM8884260.1 ANTAR domain-containing protein [Candidatus Thiodiazotropha sp.]